MLGIGALRIDSCSKLCPEFRFVQCQKLRQSELSEEKGKGQKATAFFATVYITHLGLLNHCHSIHHS